MAIENKCPHCGKSVPVTALQGICPECLLKAGIAETGEVGPDGTVVAKAPLPIPRTEDLAPHFPQLEILECLGRGGMGTVYKARHPRLDRFVALKILSRKRDSGISDAEFAARFQQEARALARLSHPDIVAVHDFGEAGGFNYLIMEFVDGVTLRQLLQTGKLPPEQALTIVPKICEALQFAHERGIVHRDIKPENILLDKQGRVKITDFGIAKILDAQTPERFLTGAKDVIGTPHYMAPEQVEMPAKVDHRADIFSLGVVFYEMLTGELPLGRFAAPSRKVQVDVRLDEVVLHALEKEPDRRYQHASEVKTDVETIAASPASGQGEGSLASKAETRNQKISVGGAIAASAILFGILAVAVVLGWLASDRSFPLAVALTVVGAATVVIISFSLWMVSALARLMGRPITFTAKTLNPGPGPGPANTEKISKLITAVRWTARVFSTLLLVFFGIFVLAEGLPPIASQPEGVQMNFVALGLMLAGFAVGWKREGAAALMIASGWTLWQISENAVRWNLFQTPLPVALLYGFCWWATRGRKTAVIAMAVVVFGLALGLGRAFVPTNIFVRGVVRDAQTGAPVQNAELRLLSGSGNFAVESKRPNTRTGEDGRFTLYVGWLSDQTPVTISAPGYETLTTGFGPRPPHRQMLRDFHLQAANPILSEPTVPPVVVETFPVSGTQEVDPRLTELRVTFSKPMHDGAWSWVKVSDTTFPDMTGSPSFSPDKRTCVLPVRLLPGKLYAVWLNYGEARNFKDTGKQGALPYLLIFETRK